MQTLDSSPVVPLLARGCIFYSVPATDKTSAIMAAVERMTLPTHVNRDHVIDEVLKRELLASTATGQGIAIPHPQNATCLELQESVLALAFLSQPVDFDAPDGQPVHALFLLLSHNPGLHLRLLAHLGRALQNTDVQKALTGQLPAEEILAIMHAAEVASSHRTASSCAASSTTPA